MAKVRRNRNPIGQVKMVELPLTSEQFGLVYDKERDMIGIRTAGTITFTNGAFDMAPEQNNIVSYGDAMHMLRRMCKSASEQQLLHTLLIPCGEYAEMHGLDPKAVRTFCYSQESYLVGVRRVKVGDGGDWFMPNSLDPRVIIKTSPDLMRVNEEIQKHLAEHPGSSVGQIVTALKRSSNKVRQELVRLVKDQKAIVNRGRFTMV